MMQLLNKKRKLIGNKGFSLVELIIVIAIMAVLVAILAPQYLKYVEKSRVSAEDSTADQIITCVRVAVADDTVVMPVSTKYTYTWAVAGGLTLAPANATLQAALTANLSGDNAKPMKAKVHNTDFIVTIDVDATGNVSVTDNKADWDK